MTRLFHVARREVRRLASHPIYWFCMLAAPLLCLVFFLTLMGSGLPTNLPLGLVDDDGSTTSRQLARNLDAFQQSDIVAQFPTVSEARKAMQRGEIYGFYYIPEGTSRKALRQEQATVSFYMNYSYLIAGSLVFRDMKTMSELASGAAVQQVMLARGATEAQAMALLQPIVVDTHPISNPWLNYSVYLSNTLLPGVLMLILQQTLVLGIGLSAGTARERNRYQDLIPFNRAYQGMFRIVVGKAMCYFMIYAVLGAYLAMVVPRIFDFVVLAEPSALLAVMLPYVLACIFFGMVVSCIVRYRENVMLLVVFASVPLLFLSGVSWPGSNIPWFWESFSWLFPSTFGIRAYVRVNTMGASLHDVAFEYRALWIQAAAYFFLACGVYRHQILMSKKHALERLDRIRRKRALRRLLRQRGGRQ